MEHPTGSWEATRRAGNCATATVVWQVHFNEAPAKHGGEPGIGVIPYCRLLQLQ